MPDNNRKVLDKFTLDKLNALYIMSYDKGTDKIVVGTKFSSRITMHDASEPFSLNVKRLNRKITFSKLEIDIWKKIQNDSHDKQYSLFDIHNEATKLKVRYQTIDEKSILDALQKN